jgi:hypothetical protein
LAAYHLAQYNIGRLHRPLDHAETAEFIAALEPINQIAESSPGFVWRLTDDDGGSSSFVAVEGIDDPLLVVNYSIWTDLESLRHFMYKSGHASYLRRRTEWFEPANEATALCWWTPAGTIPHVDEAQRRLVQMRANGPSDQGWPLTKPLDPPA